MGTTKGWIMFNGHDLDNIDRRVDAGFTLTQDQIDAITKRYDAEGVTYIVIGDGRGVGLLIYQYEQAGYKVIRTMDEGR